MDPYTFISRYAPRGSVIFINYLFSLTEYFNPSYDKHVAIYLGYKDTDVNTIFKCENDDEKWIVESIYESGVTATPLFTLLKNANNVKVYILDEYNNEHSLAKMSLAADVAITFIGKPYGFGSNNLYCFKLVAECYDSVGIQLPTYNILGKRVYLSQSFIDNIQWKKIYDSDIF
ncbi:NlpC/P60 superfamily protein [Cotia virus SPAn232]|uniref:Protein OPG091 n=2 Tax=Cotia virus TaxID=39444 RepID=H6TA48_9POXV|nr:NlpC/P60 superfamily protein [Cotia virus SPAn232]ADT91088.1 NlpC/P60 superfamily protein [Cotia virus SPAn232]AIT70687.1 NlpC/P60 superfamily protein [Cotia virus]